MDTDERRELEHALAKATRVVDKISWRLQAPERQKSADAKAEQIASLKAQREEILKRSGSSSDHNVGELLRVQRQLKALEPAPIEKVEDEAPAETVWCSPCGYSFPRGGKCPVCKSSAHGVEHPLQGIRESKKTALPYIKSGHALTR